MPPGTPVTYERPVETDDLDKYIEKPHVPRPHSAPSKENPKGKPQPREELKRLSVMQQHVAFFDRNCDGIIYPWETFAGLRAVGFNPLLSLAGAFLVNSAMSYPTQNSWIPSPFFSMVIRNIHKAKHGSDSGVYDKEGRFVPEKFEELFTKFDKGRKGALTFSETLYMTQANREVADFFGWRAEKLEWGAAYLLLKDKNGLVSKDTIRGIYDSTIFYELERQQKKFCAF